MAVVQKVCSEALWSGNLWGCHLSYLKKAKLVLSQEWKLQTDHNHVGLGFPVFLECLAKKLTV